MVFVFRDEQWVSSHFYLSPQPPEDHTVCVLDIPYRNPSNKQSRFGQLFFVLFEDLYIFHYHVQLCQTLGLLEKIYPHFSQHSLHQSLVPLFFSTPQFKQIFPFRSRGKIEFITDFRGIFTLKTLMLSTNFAFSSGMANVSIFSFIIWLTYVNLFIIG